MPTHKQLTAAKLGHHLSLLVVSEIYKSSRAGADTLQARETRGKVCSLRQRTAILTSPALQLRESTEQLCNRVALAFRPFNFT